MNQSYSVITANNKILTHDEQDLMIMRASVLPLPTAWLRGDYVVKDVDNKVSRWTDISGNGNHFDQTTLSAQPIWSANISEFNNEPGLLFTVQGQFLECTLGQLLIGMKNRALFVVGKTTKNASFYCQAWAGNVVDRFAMIYENGDGYIFHDSTNRGLVSAGVLGTKTIWSMVMNREVPNIVFRRNSSLLGSPLINANYNWTSEKRRLIGAYEGFSGNGFYTNLWLLGTIMEIIIYDTVTPLTAEQISSIENYLNLKYNVF